MDTQDEVLTRGATCRRFFEPTAHGEECDYATVASADYATVVGTASIETVDEHDVGIDLQ